MAEPSTASSSSSKKDKGKQILSDDFNFQLNPSTNFRLAIAALSNQTFNPSKMGLMEVDDSGLSITVYSVPQPKPGSEEKSVFGLFRLQPEYFELFECNNPVTAMINLEEVLLSLYTGEDNCLLTVSSATGSNQVMFEFVFTGGRVDSAVAPVIDLQEVKPDYPRLPNIRFELAASIQSPLLVPLISHILQQEVDARPDSVTVVLQPSSASLEVEVYTAGEPPEKGEMLLNWPFWETLEWAVQTTDECRIFMVIDPAESIMLLFNLSCCNDEMVTFRRVYFSRFQRVSCLAFFRSLS